MIDTVTQFYEEEGIYEAFNPVIREFLPTDQNFLLKTWLRGFQPERARVSPPRYFRKQQEVIRRICNNKMTRLAVVCDADNPEFIVGFAIADDVCERAESPLIVHYVFVKSKYRKHGFAKMLLKHLGWYPGRECPGRPKQESLGRLILCTHWTRTLEAVRHHLNLEYDPYILMNILDPYDYEKVHERTGRGANVYA